MYTVWSSQVDWTKHECYRKYPCIIVKYKVIKLVHCPSQMNCIARRSRRKRLNRIVLGLKLIEHKSEKPKFLSDPNSYIAILGVGVGYMVLQS